MNKNLFLIKGLAPPKQTDYYPDYSQLKLKPTIRKIPGSPEFSAGNRNLPGDLIRIAKGKVTWAFFHDLRILRQSTPNPGDLLRRQGESNHIYLPVNASPLNKASTKFPFSKTEHAQFNGRSFGIIPAFIKGQGVP